MVSDRFERYSNITQGYSPIEITGKSSTIYQVDHQIIESGQRVKGAKRCYRWIYGYVNPIVLTPDAGIKTGGECRGQEHTVILSISLTSGKKSIEVDGEQVYTSTAKTPTLKVACLFKGMKLQVYGRLSNDSFTSELASTPDFELAVDGKPFRAFKKLYELDNTSLMMRSGPGSVCSGSTRSYASQSQSQGYYGESMRSVGLHSDRSTASMSNSHISRRSSTGSLASLAQSTRVQGRRSSDPPLPLSGGVGGRRRRHM